MHTEPLLRGGRWVSDASAHLEAWLVGRGPSGWSALGPGVRYMLTFYTWGEVCFSGSMWIRGKKGLVFKRNVYMPKISTFVSEGGSGNNSLTNQYSGYS